MDPKYYVAEGGFARIIFAGGGPSLGLAEVVRQGPGPLRQTGPRHSYRTIMALKHGAVRGLYLPGGGRVVVHGWKSVALAVALAALGLAGVALYNGFPLVWPDTGSYLGLENLGLRSPFYGLFVHLSGWRWTLWPVVVVQCLMVAYLLWLTGITVFSGLGRLPYLTVVGLLVAFSSAPWVTGLIMPDLFAPVLCLSLYLLAFHAHELARREKTYLTVLAFLAVAMHTAHLPIGLGAIVVLMVLRWAGELSGHSGSGRVQTRESGSRKGGRRWFLRVGVPVVLGGAAMVANGYLIQGTITPSPYGHLFLSARLLADGPARRVLAEECPREGWYFCDFQDAITDDSDQILWDPDGPIRPLGGNFDPVIEGMRELVHLTVRRYPGEVAMDAITNTAKQFVLVDTGWGLESYINDPYPTDAIQDFYPRQLLPYYASRQSQETLWVGELIRPIHEKAMWAALGGMVVVMVLGAGFGRWNLVRAGAFVLLFLVVNAAVTGSLSTPNPRYQSRVVWLVHLYALAGGWSLLRNHRAKA